MKKLINLANFTQTIDKFNEGKESVEDFLKQHNIDAVELMLYEEDIKVSKEIVHGLHLRTWSYWMDFWKGNHEALLHNLISKENIHELYNGSSSKALVDWYKKEFELALGAEEHIELCFTNVDYYCKVWLNGVYLGSHEGYSAPFSFSLDEAVQRNGKNRLIVKVWSPWDDEVAANRQERRTFLIYRNMVKGTYEHSDTFIQRDVNPVGIYGSVSLKIQKGAGFAENPEFSYQLDDTLENASLHLKVKIKNLETASLKWSITDCFTGAEIGRASCRERVSSPV